MNTKMLYKYRPPPNSDQLGNAAKWIKIEGQCIFLCSSIFAMSQSKLPQKEQTFATTLFTMDICKPLDFTSVKILHVHMMAVCCHFCLFICFCAMWDVFVGCIRLLNQVTRDYRGDSGTSEFLFTGFIHFWDQLGCLAS